MNPISIALLVLVAAYTPATLHANENTLDAINPAPTEPSAAELSSTDQKYGPTKPGETLAQVAQQVLTDATINNEQMMWALYTANPKAFEKGKINRLRTGVFLIVPTLEQARSVDAKIAHREIEKRTARAAPRSPPLAHGQGC